MASFFSSNSWQQSNSSQKSLTIPLASLISVSLSSRQSLYSSTEVSFANSWVNSAEYVSAAHFQSNLEKSAMFISPLPTRILQARTHNSTDARISKPITYLQPVYLSHFCSVCHICACRRATALLTLPTWVRRRTTHCISSPGWTTSTL